MSEVRALVIKPCRYHLWHVHGMMSDPLHCAYCGMYHSAYVRYVRSLQGEKYLVEEKKSCCQ